jgi:hypothetical protein
MRAAKEVQLREYSGSPALAEENHHHGEAFSKEKPLFTRKCPFQFVNSPE